MTLFMQDIGLAYEPGHRLDDRVCAPIGPVVVTDRLSGCAYQ